MRFRSAPSQNYPNPHGRILTIVIQTGHFIIDYRHQDRGLSNRYYPDGFLINPFNRKPVGKNNFYLHRMLPDLFGNLADPAVNLLPRDGTVRYYGPVFSKTDADRFLDALLTGIAWKQDEALIMGKRIVTKRKVAWHGDQPFEYTYSRITKTALPWTEHLRALKAIAEKVTGETYNSCLLNLYHSGDEGMAWHSDGEPDLKKNGAIASMSFGAERKFSFKHKHSGERVDILLEHGSLLLMTGATQAHWLHRLPPTKKVSAPRVNLTFRTIVG